MGICDSAFFGAVFEMSLRGTVGLVWKCDCRRVRRHDEQAHLDAEACRERSGILGMEFIVKMLDKKLQITMIECESDDVVEKEGASLLSSKFWAGR